MLRDLRIQNYRFDATKQEDEEEENNRPKAFIHTWLAWQEVPGMPMGQAITARVLGNGSEIAPHFHHWLTDLFR
ncbi:MAG: hypothetical protein J7647_30685 [Cyanobacteria bacterium SBLK]|nr:hypothetical protein [Cyanobacteria bacterium SBLK]